MEPPLEQAEPDLGDILRRAGLGDETAWRQVIDLYSRRVYALARSRCGNHDTAEEVTQSVFVTVASKLTSGGYAEQGRFESWLFRVAMNRVRDEARRRQRHAESSDPLVFQAMPVAASGSAWSGSAASGGGLEGELEALRRALGQLPEPDREVVELRHHAGMSFKEIALLLEEPLGTLLARHHRALRKLKTMIEPSDAEGSEKGAATDEA